MNIERRYLSLGKLARGENGKPVKFSKPLERIIIHWIGPYPWQTVNSPWEWWENGADGKGVIASAHFIVKDKVVIQCLPLDEVGWHSGDGRNYDSIGIEVVPCNIEGEFSKESIDTLRLLVAHIRKETGRDLKLERHFDGVQKKDCPRFYTPLSEIITKEEQYNNVEMNGQQRWENLKLFLNDWDRISPKAA